MSSRAEWTIMFRKLIAVWVLVGTMLVPALTRAAAPLELKSVTVDFPEGDQSFPGPGRRCQQQQWPPLSAGGHGAPPAGGGKESLARRGKKDDHRLQGPRGARRRPRHHRLSDTSPERQIGQAPRFA